MAISDRADSVDVKERLPYINDRRDPREGSYTLRIERVKEGVNPKKKTMNEYFVIDFEVVASEGANAFQPGDRVTHFLNQDVYDFHIRDIKLFLAALTKLKVRDVTGARIRELTSEDQPAAGMLVKALVAPNERGFLTVKYASA